MLPSVLVPLDGSPEAEQALPWATSLASRTGGAIRLVGVHAPPAVYLDGQTLVGSVTPDEEVRAQEQAYLDEVEQRVRHAHGVSISSDLIDGSVLDALVEQTRIVQPAWTVMTSHARGAIARFFLGSTALEYVRHAPGPVLLLHTTNHEPPDLSHVPTIETVVVPLDGSLVAEQSILPAIALAKLYHARVQVIMVLDAVPEIENIAIRHEPGLPGPWDEAAVHTKAEYYLEHMADRCRAHGLTAHTQLIPHGAASTAIVAAAQGLPNAIIALTTHGRGGLAKLVWGSVTEQIVRHTTTPVLITSTHQ